MQPRVVIMLVVNGQAIWRSEGLIQPKCARRMTDQELKDIGEKTAEVVEKVAGTKSFGPAVVLASSAQDRKRKR